MDWSIALEEQAKVRATLARILPHTAQQQEFFGEFRTGILPALRTSLGAACEGEAIFVEPAICRALAEEAPNVPDDWMLTADMMIAAPAFCWLGEPVGYARMADSQDIPLVGYTWAIMPDSQGVVGPNIMALTHTNFHISYSLVWLGLG